MNNYYKRRFVILAAGSLFAGMLLTTASAELSPERTTLNAEISKTVSPNMASKIPANEDLVSSQQDCPSYLADYAYSEVPSDKKPADIGLDSLKDVPNGTPIEEFKRASDAFCLDFNFMKSVARIESDFDPKHQTGSYFGLFQLSKDEFAHYGLMLAIMLLPLPTNLRLRPNCSS